MTSSNLYNVLFDIISVCVNFLFRPFPQIYSLREAWSDEIDSSYLSLRLIFGFQAERLSIEHIYVVAFMRTLGEPWLKIKICDLWNAKKVKKGYSFIRKAIKSLTLRVGTRNGCCEINLKGSRMELAFGVRILPTCNNLPVQGRFSDEMRWKFSERQQWKLSTSIIESSRRVEAYRLCKRLSRAWSCISRS